jgi:RHS repeat-associated protein
MQGFLAVPGLQSTRSACLALALTVGFAPLAPAQEAADPVAAEFPPPTFAESVLREAPQLLQKGVWRHKTELSLPPTPFQAQPELALVGGHRSGGLAGLHWTVQGFASIERRGPNGGAPTRSDADTFQYQGMKLIETGDTSDRPRSFRLEKDTNQVFFYYPRTDSWSMSKDGWTHRYGDLNLRDVSNASEHFHFGIGRNEICRGGALVDPIPLSQPAVPPAGPGKVLKWHLRRVTDPGGNTVQYSYTGPCDCDPIGKLALVCPHLPKEVSYNTANIEFEFEDKPDTRIMARDGVPRYFNKRLKRITTRVKGDADEVVFSDYAISYKPDAPRSLVHRIERLSADGGTRVLAEADYDMTPTGFQQGASIAAIEQIIAEYPTQHVVPHVVNFDGDGFPDLVLIDERIDGQPNTLGMARGYRNNGQDDFSFILDPEMTQMLTDALGPTAENGFESPRREPGTFKFADIDGDGRTELHANGIWEYEPGIGYRETGWAESNVGSSEWLLVDIDGDGLDDKVEAGFAHTWIRNQGEAPFFPESEKQDLTLPVEWDNEFGLDIRSQMERCGTGPYTGWISEDHAAYHGYLRVLGTAAYGYPWEYWMGQINYADLTGDGIADMIYGVNNCPTYDDPDQDTYAWSKVFVGRGDGTFVYSDLDAGPPFLQVDSPADVGNPDTSVDITTHYLDRHERWLDWKSWSPVDFDGDGIVEILHRPDGEERLYSAHFKSAAESWTFGPDDPAALILPPRVKALSTYSRMGYKPYYCACFFHQVTLPADWDGDGFTDLFVLQREAVSDAALLQDRTARNYETYLYRNTREAPHYAMTGVRGPDGGQVRLGYSGSARNGSNTDLPVSMPVVSSVSDDRGTSRFHYSGGRIESGEFLGFAEVEGIHENGLSFEAEYSLSPAFRGDLVSRTERRRDGTIERYSVFERMRLATSIFTFDGGAPFFNPVRRACQFEVSNYQGAGPGLPPDPTEDALFKAQMDHECTTWNRPGLSWITEPNIADFLGLVNGWDPRHPVGHRREQLNDVNQLREVMATLSDRPLSRPLRIFGASEPAARAAAALPWKRQRLNGSGTGADKRSRPAHAEIDTDFSNLLALTGSLILPNPGPGGAGLVQTASPDYRMFVKDFAFNADQRVVQIRDHNLSDVPDDWVTTDFTYAPYKAQNIQGAELTLWQRSFSGGSYSTAFGDHFAIGMPGEIEEVGTDGTRRVRELTYDKQGRTTRATQQADADGRMLVEHFTYDGPCGLRDTVTDAAGRVLTYSRDAACRTSGSAFEGGQKTFLRDGFGRIVETTLDPGGAPAKRTRQVYNDAFNTPLRVLDHVEVTEDLAIGTFRDRWGRPVLTMRCTLPSALQDELPEKVEEFACDPGSEHYTLRGWSVDGSQRLTSSEFRRGEVPYMAFTFFDERGRLVRRAEPDHSYQAKPGDALAGFDLARAPGWIETTYAFGLGFTRTDTPGGKFCIERFSTLSREVECNGQLMGSYKLDAEGRITSATDEMGVGTDFDYDGFFNLKTETTNATLDTCSGAHTNPQLAYRYDLRGRLMSKTLPNGAELSWTYDEIGRLLTAEFREQPGGPVLDAGRWEYKDHADGALSTVEIDSNGNRTTRYRDAFGRPLRSELPDGTFTETTRDAFGRAVSIRDIDGRVQHFEYDTLGRVITDYFLVPEAETESCRLHDENDMCRVGMSYEHDGAGRITATIDADGVRERHGYTAHGQLAFSARGPWIMQAASYNDDGTPDWIWTDGSYTRFTYDAWMRPSEICGGADLAAGTCVRTTTITRDAAGRILTRKLDNDPPLRFEYDALGRMTKRITPLGGIRTFRHSRATPVCEQTDEEGLITRWRYDAFGRLTAYQPPEFETPREYLYEFGVAIPGSAQFGARTLVTEPDGGQWETLFDFADRPVRETRPDRTVLSYRYGGAQLQQIELLNATGTPKERLRYGYDSLGRLAYEAGPSLDSGPYLPGQYGLSFSYTDAGRPLERTGPVNAPGGAPIFATRNAYGLYGLMTLESQVGVVDTRFGYDVQHRFPRLKTVATGPHGTERVTRYDYAAGGLDLAGITVSGPISGTDTPEDQELVIAFDDYDSYGQPGTVTRTLLTPSQSVAQYRGRYVTDANGRLVGTKTRVGLGADNAVKYSYRRNGEVSGWLIDDDHGQELEYDKRGRLTRVSLTDARGALTQLAYEHIRFDPLGRPLETNMGDGARVSYSHDRLGRMVSQSVELAGGARRQMVTRFDARGLPEVEEVRIGNRQTRSEFSYSPEGWLTGERQFNRAGDLVDDLAYQYDAAGNRTRMERLGQPEVDYVYGPVKSGTDTGDALLEVVTDAIPQALEWDAYGGMTVDQRGFGIVRDVTGRASQIWDANDYLAAEIGRDHLHRAVSVKTSEEARLHLWGNPLSNVYPLATARAGESMGFVATDQMMFGVGRAGLFETALTDRGGTLLNDGNQFVDLARAFGTGVSKPQSGVPFVFAGQEILEGTPFLNAQQRLYDPEVGLFASTDPLGESGSRHRFRYASNAPTIRIDPLGTENYIEHDGMGEAGQQIDIDGTGEDPTGIDLGPSQGTFLEGWNIDGSHVIDSDGMRYPVTEVHEGVNFPGNDGGYVPMTVFNYHDNQGNEGWVAVPTDSQTSTEIDVDPNVTDTGPTDIVGPDPGETPPGDDNNPPTDPKVDGQETAPDGSDPGIQDTGADYSDVPPNFNGSASDWAGREQDGYYVGADGYARTPSGQLVIPNLNDALNPSPLKVLVNLGADTVDDALKNVPGVSLGQQLGLIDPNVSPANDAIKGAGWGYTPSEKPRETIAEVSMTIATSAVTAPASAAAAARGQAVLARGCAGPLGSAPRTVRILLNVNCFAPETEVITESGPRRIDRIEPGDRVACGYDDGSAPEFCEVDGVTITPNRAFAVLEVIAKDGSTERLRVTKNHRFYSHGKGWVELAGLSQGDRINTAGGQPVTITALRIGEGGGGEAYNLKVAGARTYFAGRLGLFTHNGGPGGVCPVTKIRNLKQLGNLLGRPGVTRNSQVTVGEVKQLLSDGKITKTALNLWLRGKSGTQRKWLLSQAQNGKVTARAGDYVGQIPTSMARNGKDWHVGHAGHSLRDMIDQANPNQSVSAFHKMHWSGTMFENAADNMRRGAGTSAFDNMLRTLDVGP